MITVIGHGSASQIPDILTLSIGIEARRASVAEAYGAAGAAMQSVLDRLRDLDVGPQDTTTSSLNIRAESGWQEGLGNVVTGYLVSSSMTVRLSFQVRAREIIAAAVEAGGDDVRLNGLAAVHVGSGAAPGTGPCECLEGCPDQGGALRGAGRTQPGPGALRPRRGCLRPGAGCRCLP